MSDERATCDRCGEPRAKGGTLCSRCLSEQTIDSPRPTEQDSSHPADTTLDGQPDLTTGKPADQSADDPPTQVDDRTIASDRPNSSPADSDRHPAAPPGSGTAVRAGGDFGDYELLDEIARGGMGVVYRARHKKLNRITALKMILGGRFSTPEEVQRFHVEAEAAAQLDHSGIVPIYEIGECDGLPFFAMKFVEGGSLAEHRDRIRRSPRKSARLLAVVARAVHHAHQRGILHRDLKPANILLDEADNPLLTDLGLAKSTSGGSDLTRTGAVVGTPSYMSPEQAKATDSVTTAADIYSLGAILYELLTGQPPHLGRSAMETVMAVMQQPVRSPREIDREVDGDLELICMKCLARDPEQRYESAAALAEDLESWLQGEPISITPPSLLAVAAKWMKRYRRIGYAIGVLLVASMFSFPMVFSVLGAMSDPASLYANTAEDPLPWIYTIDAVPIWLSLTAVAFAFLIWPLLGLFITLVTKPRNLQNAAFNGFVFAGVTAVLFTILLGWMLFLSSTWAAVDDQVVLLARSVWSDDAARSQIEEQLLERVPGLAEKPPDQRAAYLTSRMFADIFALGPLNLVAIAAQAMLLAGPIFVGATISHLLIDRGGWWLWILVRYVTGWLFLTVGLIVVLAAFSDGQFNGQPFSDLDWVSQALSLLTAPFLAWLVLRRWRRKKTS